MDRPLNIRREPAPYGSCAIVGRGRMGRALAEALAGTGQQILGPLGRGDDLPAADIVLLAVPDSEIAAAARRVPPGPLVGHLSGASGLDVLVGHEAFGLHPLMTITGPGARFAGAWCAVAGSTPRASGTAHALARALGMRAFTVADADRPAYHAAASAASNFLVALESAAEELAATAAVPRDALVPLVRATVENWAATGAAALTGPIARGDEDTVARQRAAVADRTPHLLPLWDAMVSTTRAVAA